MSQMIRVIQSSNAFDIQNNYNAFDVAGGLSVWEIFMKIGVVEFKHQLTVTVDKKELPFEEWDNPIKGGSVVGIVPKVEGGIVTLIIVSVLAIAAIAIALSLSVPVPSDPTTSEPDPVYSLKGQTNQLKLGSPIEANYGAPRVWPSMGAKPYNKYISNESWQYSLLCIGHGYHEVGQVYIEDTPIEDFNDIYYEVYQPNETVTMFRDNVQTSTEVGSQELYGPNEDNYDSWFTATANDAGTTTDLIELDLAFPSGLYRQDDEGRLRKVTVTAEFEYIEIDDSGVEIGTWTSLKNFTKALATVTPQRFTISQSVTPARYKVRGRRTNDASNSYTVQDTVQWETMRAYLPNVGTYGDVTMLAVRARATANLNSQSQYKINCEVVRKLPIYNGSEWSEPTATRSVVWAFCDVFRASYGADLTDKILSLPSLVALDVELESEGIYFDWTFDSKTTIWEAAKTVCAVARAIPILDGSQIYIVRDKEKTVIQDLFNDENIIQDSFEMSVSLYKQEEYDSIEVEYRDPDTWKTETVLCALPDSFGERPESLIIAGVTDRDRAYRLGMRILSEKKYQRREVSFSTGVEGFLSTYGDFVKVEYDTFGIEDAVGGYIVAVSADRLTLTLSKPVTFTDTFDYRLLAKGRDGTIYGPYVATEGSWSCEVILDSPITEELNFAYNSEQPIFNFGRSVSFAQDCVITGLTPSGGDEVNVTALLYDSRVYAYDDATAPELDYAGTQIEVDPLPVVTGVDIIGKGGDTFTISWTGSASAQSYIIQTSADPDEYDVDANEAWETVGQTTATSFDVTILTAYIYIRVAAVNVGQGPWAYHDELIEGAVLITQNTDTELSLNVITQGGDRVVTYPN